MIVETNLKDVKNFVTSDKFANFLLSNTTDFSTAAFVLSVLLEKIDELERASIEAETDC